MIKHISSLIIASLLLFTCTGLDDKPLPRDAWAQVYFQNFEIDPQRNYILGRIINDSPYTLTSCKIEVKIYQENLNSEKPLSLIEILPGDSTITGKTPILLEKMFMREMLGPGYSTEIYFELRLQDFNGPAFFTKEIVELKGKANP